MPLACAAQARWPPGGRCRRLRSTGSGASRITSCGQGFALEEFHGDERPAVIGGTKVGDVDDVFVADGAGEARLLQHRATKSLLARNFSSSTFTATRFANDGVARLVHRAHTAPRRCGGQSDSGWPALPPRPASRSLARRRRRQAQRTERQPSPPPAQSPAATEWCPRRRGRAALRAWCASTGINAAPSRGQTVSPSGYSVWHMGRRASQDGPKWAPSLTPIGRTCQIASRAGRKPFLSPFFPRVFCRVCAPHLAAIFDLDGTWPTPCRFITASGPSGPALWTDLPGRAVLFRWAASRR
jgi:hypothetical protein